MSMYEKSRIPRSGILGGDSPALPPPPTPEGCVGFAVESLDKQIYATGEALAEVYRRLDRVLVPNNTDDCPKCPGGTPVDGRMSPLTNSLLAMENRLGDVRRGLEELLCRINL